MWVPGSRSWPEHRKTSVLQGVKYRPSPSGVRAPIQWQLFCFCLYVFSSSSISLKLNFCLIQNFVIQTSNDNMIFKQQQKDLTTLSTVENNNWDISGRVFWFCNIEYVTGRMKRRIERWQVLQCDVDGQGWVQDKHWHLNAVGQQTFQLLLTGKNTNKLITTFLKNSISTEKPVGTTTFSRCFSISCKKS